MRLSKVAGSLLILAGLACAGCTQNSARRASISLYSDVRLGDHVYKAKVAFISADFFSTANVRPYLGRVFESQEKVAAAILSYRFWQTLSSSDPNIIGKKIHIGTSTYIVVGVLPASFGTSGFDLWLWFKGPNPGLPDLYRKIRDLAYAATVNILDCNL